MPDTKILEENHNFWQDRYNKNNIGWHMEDVHPHLVKYLHLLTGGSSSEESARLKFFLPLCGKTKDIPYLLSLGHDVFGVECVESAIKQLDEENLLNLKFDESQSLYYTEDRRLRIYFGDYFTCPIETWGPFDCIWDRGSFIAIDYPLRESYVNVLKRSVDGKSAHIFRYFVQTVRYDKKLSNGPPKSVDEEDLAKYFKSWMKMTQVDKLPVPDDSPLRSVSGRIDSEFHEIYFLGEPKL